MLGKLAIVLNYLIYFQLKIFFECIITFIMSQLTKEGDTLKIGGLTDNHYMENGWFTDNHDMVW